MTRKGRERAPLEELGMFWLSHSKVLQSGTIQTGEVKRAHLTSEQQDKGSYEINNKLYGASDIICTLGNIHNRQRRKIRTDISDDTLGKILPVTGIALP